MDLSRTSDSQGFIKNSPLTLNYPRTSEGHIASSPYTHSKEAAKEILNSQGLLNSMALNFSTKVEGQHSSFPYGLSGVAMPNYAYTGDLYQFTSNGYPRKSRTCSYCSKVFTRSTTRRYHEKRCPRLRAAVCGIVQDDDKKSKFPQLPSPHGRNSIETSTSGYDKLSGNSLKPHSASTSKLSSTKFKGDDSLENTASVIMKKETQEHLASLYADKSREFMSDSHPMSDLHAALAAYKQSNFRNISLSPFHLGAAMDFNKSPSRTSSGHRDDQESLSNDETANANGSDVENFERLRHSIENEDLKFDEMSKRVKRESPSSDGRMMPSFNEIGKSEQNNNGENLDQSGNTSNIKCGVCGKMFASQWQLHVHEQIHTKFKPYACRFCGERFSKAALRIQHERLHETSTNDQEVLVNAEHICVICGSSFKKDNLRLHMLKYHKDGPWLCRECGKAAVSHQDLYDHLKSHDQSSTEAESLQYLLDMANGTLTAEVNGVNDEMEEEELEGENESDSNENLTSPEQESPSEMPMNIEGEVDPNEEKEMCTICGRDIPKSHMGYHLKSHEGQKPYECPICKKRFGYKNNMKSHIKLHDGIKPYQCNICGAKFTRGSTLRRHARRHGISAESVWDLFVKNDSQQSNHVSRENHKTDLMNLSGSSMAEIPNSKFTDSSPYSNFNSLFSHPTSVAMSNALFMNYHNQAMAGASLPSLYSLHSTSEIPPPSAGFDTSSQSPQKDALNLSVHKQDAGTDNEIPSPTSISRSRSRSLSGSESIKNDLMGTSLKIDCSDIGIQVKSCCKMGMDIPLMMGACSPSDNASIQSGDSAATLAALENSPDNIASLLAAGKLYKCEPCECYFSEYAMYRIHSKIHPGGKSLPFTCPICNEDCHDKVYFSLHVSEHLR